MNVSCPGWYTRPDTQILAFLVKMLFSKRPRNDSLQISFALHALCYIIGNLPPRSDTFLSGVTHHKRDEDPEAGRAHPTRGAIFQGPQIIFHPYCQATIRGRFSGRNNILYTCLLSSFHLDWNSWRGKVNF